MATFRKIIQITAIEVQNTELWQGGYTLVALCDDGSLWSQHNGESWFKIDTTQITESSSIPETEAKQP